MKCLLFVSLLVLSVYCDGHHGSNSPDCPAGSPQVQCFANPCTNAECPKHQDATCHPSYCGGCWARFKTPSGEDVTDDCRDGTATTTQQATTAAPVPKPCGNNFCHGDDTCCNESCGICAAPNGVCTQQACSGTCCPYQTEPGRYGNPIAIEGHTCCNGEWKANSGVGTNTCGQASIGHRCRVPDCKAGDEWYDGCNACTCTSEGRKLCTQRVCETDRCYRAGESLSDGRYANHAQCLVCRCLDATSNSQECYITANCKTGSLEDYVKHYVDIKNIRVTLAQFELILEKFRMHAEIVSKESRATGFDCVVALKDTKANGVVDATFLADLQTHVGTEISKDGVVAPVVRSMGTSQAGTTNSANSVILGTSALFAALLGALL